MERRIYRYGEAPEDPRALHPGDIIEIDFEITKNNEDVELPMGIYILIDHVFYESKRYQSHLILDVSEENDETDQSKMIGLFKEIEKAVDFGSRHILKELLDMHFLYNDQINCLIELIDQGNNEAEKALFKEILDYIANP